MLSHLFKHTTHLILLFHVWSAMTIMDFVHAQTYSYKEHLNVQQLHDGRVFMHFHFAQSLVDMSPSSTNWQRFPRDMGRIANHFDLKQLQISLTQGRWQDTRWRLVDQDVNSVISKTAGAELLTWFHNGNGTDVDVRWKQLTHTLSGIFCASLHFIDSAKTTVPKMTFQKPKVSDGENDDLSLRYGFLPKETTCTENLTPWMKLLPCMSNSGLASLLNAYKIYDSNYHSMRIGLHRSCESSGKCSFELLQDLFLVLDPYRLNGQRRDWKLSSLLGRSVRKGCPLVDETAMAMMAIPHDINIEPVGDVSFINWFPMHSNYEYIVLNQYELDFGISQITLAPEAVEEDLHIERYLTGYGEEFGGLRIDIKNPKDHDIEIVYFDKFPWFMRIYMHSLKTSSDFIHHLEYQPAIDRVRPTVIEMKCRIPAKSTQTFTLHFQKTLLQYSEYPPDASRGFDLGGAIITIFDEGKVKQIQTNNLLLTLPTPDFSMPYNVITLTCSALALYFGNLFNAMVRSFKSPLAAPAGLRGVIFRLITMLKAKLKKK